MKIKQIKTLLLIICIIFLAGFNYFTFVKAANSTNGSINIDTDNDGLSNKEESIYGTDPNNSDTDGDGYSDGVEVKSGYNPLIKAPNDKLESKTNSSVSNQNQENISLTDDFAAEFKQYIASKDKQSITNSDISDFISLKLQSKQGEQITEESLPSIDTSKINILNQSYSNLSSDERKKRIKDDASKYLTELSYILLSNSPKVISSQEDLAAFNAEFLDNAYALSDINTDYSYFSNLGKRLDTTLEQLNAMSVPETILPLHIKMMRITKGFLSLRDFPDSSNDPIVKLQLFSKITALTTLATDFVSIDVTNYLNNL